MRRSPTAVFTLLTLAQTERLTATCPSPRRCFERAIDINSETLGYDGAAQIDLIDALAHVLRRAGRNVEADAIELRERPRSARKSGQVGSAPVGGTAPTSRIEKVEKR